MQRRVGRKRHKTLSTTRSTISGVWLALAASVVLFGCGPSIGDACTTDQNCGGRTCISDNSFPGGYCTEHCVQGDSSGCPGGSSCVEHNGQALCLRNCSDTSECRGGYTCHNYKLQGTFCLSPNDN
jgi:hypothetical protein